MSILCRVFGHRIPRTIRAPSPYLVVTARYEDGSETGRAGPITCFRCGHKIGPMDAGYPMILPSEETE